MNFANLKIGMSFAKRTNLFDVGTIVTLNSQGMGIDWRLDESDLVYYNEKSYENLFTGANSCYIFLGFQPNDIWAKLNE